MVWREGNKHSADFLTSQASGGGCWKPGPLSGGQHPLGWEFELSAVWALGCCQSLSHCGFLTQIFSLGNGSFCKDRDFNKTRPAKLLVFAGSERSVCFLLNRSCVILNLPAYTTWREIVRPRVFCLFVCLNHSAALESVCPAHLVGRCGQDHMVSDIKWVARSKNLAFNSGCNWQQRATRARVTELSAPWVTGSPRSP